MQGRALELWRTRADWLTRTLLVATAAIVVMIAAAAQFGATGLLLVAIPLIGGLAVRAFMNAGGDGSSSDGA